jgi:flavodoxin
MDGFNILLVDYSRTGTTRQAGMDIAHALACDIEAIHDRKKRGGPLGFVAGGKDAMLKKLTEIEPPANDPAAYDLVIVGTPVWANTMAPAVRTFLTQYRESLPRVAFFLTTMRSGLDKTFRDMAQVCGQEPVATLGLLAKPFKAGQCEGQVSDFVGSIRSLSPAVEPGSAPE